MLCGTSSIGPLIHQLLMTCKSDKTTVLSGASLRVGAFQPKKESAAKFKREKNWGFVEEEGALMIYYALLPCTVVLEFDLGQPDGVVMRSRACYADQATVIGAADRSALSTHSTHSVIHQTRRLSRPADGDSMKAAYLLLVARLLRLCS